jgi:hypothetical protein
LGGRRGDVEISLDDKENFDLMTNNISKRAPKYDKEDANNHDLDLLIISHQ